MNQTKKVNLVFLSTVAIVILIMFFGNIVYGWINNSGIQLLFNQVLILLPSIIFLLVNKINPIKYLRFNKLRASTVILLILFSYLLLPVMSLINMLSMLLVKNKLANAMQEIIGQNGFLVSLILMAVVPALFEEIVYRGFFFREYRDQSVRKGILLSGFLFGLIHLNGNQFSYAFILGIVFAIVIEATDSIVSTIIIHFIINGTSVFLNYIYPKLLELLSNIPGNDGLNVQEIQDSMANGLPEQFTFGMIIKTYGIAALISGALAFVVFKAIAKNNDRWDNVLDIFRKKEEKTKLISLSLAIAILICIAFMVYIELR